MQKGFLKGIPGCIEHTFALHEELRDAYTHHKQIVISWIDLANAYGSIKHNLIQFALEWYHVPSLIRELIYSYYNTLLFKISTKEWDSTALNFSIGLFQGCILSTILFDIVFNLLLDLLSKHSEVAYLTKIASSQSLLKA